MAYKNMSKLLIRKKTEKQVCHDFDQFLPLIGVVKPNVIVRQPINLLHISFHILKCLTGEH